MQRVFDELNCLVEDSLKCVISLLKEDAYQWWVTLTSVTPSNEITLEFFQKEFKKKYISQLYLEDKKREFFDLKQENMSVMEYERKFVNLSKYAREQLTSKVEMCARSERGLNEDIRAMVGILEIKEFVVFFITNSKNESDMERKAESQRQ